jgi:hypothetical protein
MDIASEGNDEEEEQEVIDEGEDLEDVSKLKIYADVSSYPVARGRRLQAGRI